MLQVITPLMSLLTPSTARATLAAATMLLAATATAAAQSAAPPPLLTAQARQRVVDSVATVVERLYPAADTGAMIARHLRRRAAAGAYRDADDARLFVRLLTQDLQATNEDNHLNVEIGSPMHPGGVASTGHGVERAERLEGNVGYLRMSHFGGGSEASRAVEAALRFLMTTDAVILDLRNSRGGSGALSNFIISHFTGPDTVHSLTIQDRSGTRRIERYTMADVPGPRRPEVPLYVLVDDVTRSAAEDVPFVLQNMKRATIVGTRTAGAGRNMTFIPVGEGLLASVSVTRVFDPRTKREWERVGITPDVPVPADSALPVAHVLALAAIGERTSDAARKRELALLAEAVRAAARPTPRSVESLRRLVGTYEGGQFVTVEGGRLLYQPRHAQPRVVLVPLGQDTFAGGSTRYEFAERAGRVDLRVVASDGSAITYPRTSDTAPVRPSSGTRSSAPAP